MTDVAELHRQQLALFRHEVAKLDPVLSEAGRPEIQFGGTIAVHSGRGVAMVAPLAGVDVDGLGREGGLAAVLWLTPGSRQTGVEEKVRAGVYALRFVRRGRKAARLEFVNARGRVAHVRPGVLLFPAAAGDGDIWDKIKKFLKDLGLDIKLVDIEFLLPEGKKRPSKIRISILFWTFDLVDDP